MIANNDQKKNRTTLVEIGITNKRIVATTGTTKHHKYDDLAKEIMLMYKAQVTVVPIVIIDRLVTYKVTLAE